MEIRLLKSLLVVSLSLLYTGCFSQDLHIEKIKIEEYKEKASSYINIKYNEVSKLPDSILSKYNINLVASQFIKEDLHIYSCPIFDLKKNDNDNLDSSDFLELIDFKNDFTSQIIKIYHNGKLICEHDMNIDYRNNFNSLFNELDFISNSLLVYKEEPVIGIADNELNIYSSKVELEKEGLLFFIRGINSSFFYRDNDFYAVKIINTKNRNSKASFEEFLEGLEVKLISIEDYLSSLNSSEFYDEEVARQVFDLMK